MDIASILASLESSRIAVGIKTSSYWFPFFESLHVIGLTSVFGTIAIVDLRLMGVASMHRAFTKVAADILKWTWAAFALTAVTGTLLFITNAGVYYHNTCFRAKMTMLLLAGINMGVFELTAGRTVQRWDTGLTPAAGKVAAILSLVLWVSIIFCGRWIGFTT